MFHGTRLFAALTLLTGLLAPGQDRKPEYPPFDDASFVKKAASAGMQEVELGRLASMKATDAEVKKFAKRTVEDHTKANDALRAAAKDASLAVPEKMADSNQMVVDRFRQYKGSDFDRDYISQQLTDHDEAVALFSRAAKEAKNLQIKTFATKTLPVIQGHLEMLKKLEKGK